MNVEKWFTDGTGLPIRELRYLKAPEPPYSTFIDDVTHRGADLLNNINEHNIIIEHYSNDIDGEHEQIIDKFLIKERDNGSFNFIKSREWLQDEKLYYTTYDLTPILVKVRKEKQL